MKIPEVLLIEIDRAPGSLATVLEVVAHEGLTVEGLEISRRTQDKTVWELTVEMDESAVDALFKNIDALPNARLIGKSDRVFSRHLGGKIKTVSKVPFSSLGMLRDLYTPGVARVCLAIRDDPAKAYQYTNIKKTVAVITDGTAILGLGNIGPLAGLPVMEGKAALFHALAGLSGVPILLDSADPATVIETVTHIAPSFGAIQLEDIGSPGCFEIEEELVRRLNKPVLHDDQHGTAVVVLSAVIRATGLVDMDLKSSTVGQIGLGAAGLGISRLLINYGIKNVLGADLDEDALTRLEGLGGKRAALGELMQKADIVIATTGVKGLIKPEMVRKDQMILALSNPEPEIEPQLALSRGACYAADGKSINNVSAFPGLFRGVLEAGAPRFTDAMLFAAAECLAGRGTQGQLVPNPLDKAVHEDVAGAVCEAALSLKSGE